MTNASATPRDLFLHAAFVRRLAGALLRDEHEADDAAQEAWRAWLERPPRTDVRAWLARVTRNAAARGRRSAARRAERELRRAEDAALKTAAGPGEALAREETLRLVVEAVCGLEEPYRSTVLARYYEDLPPRSIARRAGVPVETVRTRLKRAHMLLRERLVRGRSDWRAALGLAVSFPKSGPAALGPWHWILGMKAKGWLVAGATLVLGFFAVKSSGVLGGSDGEEREVQTPSVASPASSGDAGEASGAGASLPAERVALAAPEKPEQDAQAAPEVHEAAPPKAPPPAELVVHAVDGATGEPVRDFSITVAGPAETLPSGSVRYTGGFASARAQDGVARMEIDVPDSNGAPKTVSLHLAGSDEAELFEEVLLVPGVTREVNFVLPGIEVLRGRVVDPEGRPIEGALVFFGPGTRGRGDEPFRAFREERIADGVRSAADGWFELAGTGDLVSAWHKDHSPATVPAAEAGTIVLAAHGALRGRLLDAARMPVAGATLTLDDRERGPKQTTGADGSFAFEGLEAGAHGLWRGKELLCAARVAAGEELVIEVAPPAAEPTLLEIRGARGELEGIAVGLAQVFTVAEVELDDAGTPSELRQALTPGPYWLATKQGVAGSFAVDAGAARAVMTAGEAELIVRAPQRVNVQVVPAGADPFLRLLAARVYARALPDAPARFQVAPGSYLLVGEAGVVLRAVDVGADGAEVTLD